MGSGLPSYDEYLDLWAPLHGGYDARASFWVRGWLRLAYTAARPLARRGVPPNAVTVGGFVVSAAAVPLCARGGRWALAGGVVVVGSALLDNLDGTVAVLTDRVTRFGYVLDSVVDRLSDAAYLLALRRLGAPSPLCVAAGGALALLEYTRARAGNAGMGEIGVVTVGERATRIVVTAAALLTAGAYPSWQPLIAGVGAAATAALAAVGEGQLLVVVRRALG